MNREAMSDTFDFDTAWEMISGGMFVDWVAALLLLAGCFFLVIGIIGFVRLPDFYTRMHAAGVIETLAVILILSGLSVHLGISQAAVKLILLLLFMLFMSPATSHALAQAAWHGGLSPESGKKGKG